MTLLGLVAVGLLVAVLLLALAVVPDRAHRDARRRSADPRYYQARSRTRR